MAEFQDPQKQELYELMHHISEDCYCAGWMAELEYALWRMVLNPRGDLRYGMGDVPLSDIWMLRELANELGGWIVWWDDADEPGLDNDGWGPRFVTMDEWEVLQKKRYGHA